MNISKKLNFDQIENCFPDGDMVVTDEDSLIVSVQWLHDFANNVNMKTIKAHYAREAAGVFALLQRVCHDEAKSAGWWDDRNPEDKNLFPSLIALVHSELSEALEGDRKGLQDDKLPHRPMREVELADAVIRICDMGGGFGMDLAGAIVEKLEYNMTRDDHKKESRASPGGKAY